MNKIKRLKKWTIMGQIVIALEKHNNNNNSLSSSSSSSSSSITNRHLHKILVDNHYVSDDFNGLTSVRKAAYNLQLANVISLDKSHWIHNTKDYGLEAFLILHPNSYTWK